MPFAADRWLHTPVPRPDARTRLLCLHHAGGASTMFASWGRLIDPRIEVCAFALPGRGGRLREAPTTQLSQLVERLVRVYREISDRPVAVFGHSMGGLLAYELLSALPSDQSGSLRHVFLSAFPPPGAQRRARRVATATDEQLIAQVIEYDPAFREIVSHADLLRLVLPAVRADFGIFEQWRPAAISTIDVPLTVLGGDEDPHVSREALEQWAGHAPVSFRLRTFRGGHFYLRHYTEELLAMFREVFAEVTADA